MMSKSLRRWIATASTSGRALHAHARATRGFIRLVPTKVVDGGTLDLGEVARGRMVMDVSDHKSRS